MAALSVTTNALADDVTVAEQPKVETSATDATPTAAPVVETPKPADPPIVAQPPVQPPPAFATPKFFQPRVADQPASGKPEKEDKDETFRMGAMAAVGFPRPFSGEVFFKIKRVVGFGAEYGFLPNSTIAGANVTFHSIAADFRVFPFKGGFFIGARAGKQWLNASETVSAGALGSMKESMAADTFFINPRIGYLKTWDSGFTVGIDAGVQIPISPNYDRDSDAAKYGISSASTDKTLVSVADVLGNKMTPTVDFLRVGFLF